MTTPKQKRLAPGIDTNEPFTMKQLRFMDYVEQHWYTNGSVPSRALTIANVSGLDSEDFNNYVKNPRIISYMQEVRGVNMHSKLTQGQPGGALTPEQLVTCNSLLNLADNRSTRKKLADLGISAGKWDAWKRDPAVQAYLRSRAENVLGDNMHEAHLGLMDAVGRGDTKAITLYYEITGRWSSKTAGELNVDFLLMRILEVIATHVSNPQTLAKISDDLLALAPKQAGVSSGFELGAASEYNPPDAVYDSNGNPITQAQPKPPVAGFKQSSTDGILEL